MKSPRGFAAALVLLLTVPVTVLVGALFGAGSATTVHLGLAAGTGLLSLAVFDFQTPRWISWIGSASLGALAVILFLQAVAEVLRNDTLTRFAYGWLGQGLETLLVDGFLVWCVAVLIGDSRGTLRVLGCVALAVVVGLKIYTWVVSGDGRSLDAELPGLKLLYLLPLVWLFFEGRAARTPRITPASIPAG
jgi:hypothetical protein